MKRERAQKEKAKTTRKVAVDEKLERVDTTAVKNELDELLEAIDSVLEKNAAEFVQDYVQLGGE